MVCHGGFSLDESVRRKWYNPEVILQDIGLTSDNVFVDVGCGDGFFSILAAKIVGEKGKVYSIDADNLAIGKLKEKAKRLGLSNIYPTIGLAEENLLCKECADIVFFSMVLHDFNSPGKVLLNAKQMLKSTGIVANLDWKKEKMTFGPPYKIRFSQNQASSLLNKADFKIKEITSIGEYHYLITAQP